MLLVNCCTLSLELLNYHSVREKTASANALEMTISSWAERRVPPLPSLFAPNRRRAWER